MLAQYPADDLRLAKYFKNTVGRQTSPSAKEYSIYTPFKWKNNSATVYSNAFRISEAYLNRAEAYAVSGETNKALADLNELRENRMKAGAAPLVIDPEGIVTTVRKERRRELALKVSGGLICVDMVVRLCNIHIAPKQLKAREISSNCKIKELMYCRYPRVNEIGIRRLKHSSVRIANLLNN